MATDNAQVLKDALVRRAIAATTLAAAELRDQLREDTPKRTGRTSRGWYVSPPPTFTGTGISFGIRHPQDEANPPDPRWLSSGTRPHVITPRNAKVLVFPGKGGAQVVAPTRTGSALVFTKLVHHPGFAGTGFIERVLSEYNVAEVFRRAFAMTP